MRTEFINNIFLGDHQMEPTTDSETWLLFLSQNHSAYDITTLLWTDECILDEEHYTEFIGSLFEDDGVFIPKMNLERLNSILNGIGLNLMDTIRTNIVDIVCSQLGFDQVECISIHDKLIDDDQQTNIFHYIFRVDDDLYLYDEPIYRDCHGYYREVYNNKLYIGKRYFIPTTTYNEPTYGKFIMPPCIFKLSSHNKYDFGAHNNYGVNIHNTSSIYEIPHNIDENVLINNYNKLYNTDRAALADKLVNGLVKI